MKEEGGVEVLKGGLEQQQQEEEGEEEVVVEEAVEEEEGEEEVQQQEEGGSPLKKRRVDDVEERVSELRFAIDKLSVVSLDEKIISTVAFLTVSNLLLLVLDKVGPTMAVLRQDVQRNIERLEDLYVLNPSVYSNLVEILKKEVGEGSAKKKESCSRAVVWLNRSMDFGVALMKRLMKDSESSLIKAVEEAYSDTFKPWHGWISSAAYKVALMLIPDRKAFTELLMAQGQDYNVLKRDVQSLITLLQPLLNEIHTHLADFQLDKLKSN